MRDTCACGVVWSGRMYCGRVGFVGFIHPWVVEGLVGDMRTAMRPAPHPNINPARKNQPRTEETIHAAPFVPSTSHVPSTIHFCV